MRVSGRRAGMLVGSAVLLVSAGLAGLGVAVLGAVLDAGPASAEIDGPCTATVDGIDVAARSADDTGDAIEVDRDSEIEIVVESDAIVDRYTVELEFAGFRWQVSEGEPDSTVWSDTIDVSDYSRFGVGLYKVHATSTGPGACEGTVLVKVGGNPLGTIAGWAGIVLGAAGLAGVTAGARRAVRGRRGRAPTFDPRATLGQNLAQVSTPADQVRLIESYVNAGPDGVRSLIEQVSGGPSGGGGGGGPGPGGPGSPVGPGVAQ
jgi:hypothetical protein